MESSCTILVATIRKPSFVSAPPTAGPERSARSPREQESLTVTTAAVRSAAPAALSTIEEDIFFLFFLFAAVGGRGRSARNGSCTRAARTGSGFFDGLAAFSLRFIEQAQAFHQQTLSVELGGFLIGLTLEVEFEVAAGPAQNLENGFIANQRSVSGVLDLSFGKKYLALVSCVVEFELATLASHFERLHEVDDVHLGKIAANHAVGGGGLRHFFESDAIYGALDALGGFFQKKRFDEIIVGRVLWRQTLIDGSTAGH